MAEVEITKKHGRWAVVIGGVDLTAGIAAGGLRVELPDSPLDFPLVHVTFRAKEFGLNLDDAVVEAQRQILGEQSDEEGGR